MHTPVASKEQNTITNINALESSLRLGITGDVDFSRTAIALYTSDASNYRQVPLGVVVPASSEDIVETVRLCNQHSVPVLMRGAGTSQNGQCVNTAVIIDCSQNLNRVLSIDESAHTALVEPGVVCDQLKVQAETLGLTFGPDPATHSRCTLGGMIGNNSCGAHSMMAGKTVENVIELEILTSDGQRFWVGPTDENTLKKIMAGNDRRAEIYRELVAIRDQYAALIRSKYPNIKRRVSGYNLDQLLPENGFNVARALVGTEGTCVTVLQARVHLIKNPEHKQLVVLGFEDIYLAGDSVPGIMPFTPIAMEGLDWGIVGGLKDRNLQQTEVAMLPDGRAWLLVELAADSDDQLQRKVQEFVTAMQSSTDVISVLAVTDESDAAAFWRIRELGASATSMSLNPGDTDPVVGWEDTAVDPHRLGDYLRDFQKLVDKYEYQTCLYGHFGDGCIHARITFDTRTQAGVDKFRNFGKDIAELVVSYGGSLSGEHGDGQAKAEFLPIMYGEELMDAFRRFKGAWDPGLRMNPGKLIDAYRVDENLRFGPEYKTPSETSVLKFTTDAGGFGRATERCTGMGKCRAQKGAMCPSYQATQKEIYSTRGRAHLLHEIMRGEIFSDGDSNGWDNTQVEDSLSHCLSCKACKTECPTQVDIAAYKAEFMHKHYSKKRRPLAHYVFGNIGTLLPTLSRFPKLGNLLFKSPAKPVINHLLRLNKQAKLPQIAEQNFKQWAIANARRNDEHFIWFGQADAPTTILWADSVNTHYRPHLLQTTIRVLQKSGFQVGVATAHFCCGRPLYEHGFLEKGKQQLNTILDSFYPTLPSHAKVVVLEPSCLSVFQDEMLKLFPEDTRSVDLSNRTMTVAQLLAENSVAPKTRLARGIIHLHCHDKSSSIDSFDRQWMQKCFDTLQEPEQSCCGMAGTYGLQKNTRRIGLKLFNRSLKGSIDQSQSDTYIVTNGFSCNSQIQNETSRYSKHPVEIIDECL